jgi:rod shape-determining protein MreC
MAGPGRGGRRRYVLVLLVLTAVTLITLDQRQGDSGPVGDGGRFAHRVVSPVSDLASSFLNPVSDWFDGVVHAGSLKRDNARLKRALAQARIEALRNESALAQNRLLTRLSGQPYLDAIRSAVGRVVASSPGNFERTITLDRGSERGIRMGMPVVAANGLVGRVFQVWSGGCNVLLLEDSEFAVGVRMVRERITGIAQGQAGRSTLTVDFSGPRSARRRPPMGELAETSGLQGSTFPPSIPVGTVKSVNVSDDGLTIDVSLIPLVDVGNLEYVKVLLWKTGSAVPPALTAATTTTTTTTTPRATTTTTSSTAPTSTSGP